MVPTPLTSFLPPADRQLMFEWGGTCQSFACSFCVSVNAPTEPAGLPDLAPSGDDEVFISSELNSSIFACTQIQYSVPLQKKKKDFQLTEGH